MPTRLRELSQVVRNLIENGADSNLLGNETGSVHALVQDPGDLQIVYRSAAPSTRKESVHPWLAFSFEPFSGLLEPFKVHGGRMWALVRMHRQPSGLPELLIHIARELPGASSALSADLEVSFSHSPRVETVIKQIHKDPTTLRFFHKAGLMLPDRSSLPSEYCLPGFADALPEGDFGDAIPGPMGLDNGSQAVYLGDLVFYNQGRTADRAKLRTFLLNCVAVGVAAHYIRDVVRKNLASA